MAALSSDNCKNSTLLWLHAALGPLTTAQNK